MAQHAILNHPDVAPDIGGANRTRRRAAGEWSPRTKLVCFLGCAAASWVLVLAPFVLIG
ncbi:MAG: hypothetical protein WD470_12455 [Rhodospirillaceae bacterium]